MKKIILAILTTLALSLSAFPAFADEPADISYTLSSSNYSNFILCQTNATSCSGYSYLLVSFSDIDTSNSYYFNLSFGSGSNLQRLYTPYVSLNYTLAFPSNIDIISYTQGNLSNFFTAKPNATITLTLSASKGCPSCPTPEPCPDPDEPFIVGLFREGFWGVATAVVTLIVPIVALFLVFRLIHDFFWGRG